MNYLKKNLHNSILPYDIMRLIYEYADPLLAVIKQIENAEYDLDELMYQKMKKMMLKHFTLDSYISFHEGLHNDYYGDEIVIDIHNIDNSIFKDVILNYSNGYKQLFLWRHKRPTSICGLNPFQNIIDLEDCLNCVDKNLVQNILCNYRYHSDGCFEKYYIKELFAVWRTIE